MLNLFCQEVNTTVWQFTLLHHCYVGFSGFAGWLCLLLKLSFECMCWKEGDMEFFLCEIFPWLVFYLIFLLDNWSGRERRGRAVGWEEAMRTEREALKLVLHLFSPSSSHVYMMMSIGSTKMCQEIQSLEWDYTVWVYSAFKAPPPPSSPVKHTNRLSVGILW